MLEARVVDRGYRPYEGPRGGPAAAVRSLAIHSTQRALGLRRPFRAKLLPIIVIGIAFFPAAVTVGIVGLTQLPLHRVLPSYADYYGFVDFAVILFTALVVPEVMCPDRRSGLLRVYLASPLEGTTYVLAKLLAIGAVLAVVTLGPLLLLLAGLTLEGFGPGGVVDVATLVLKVLASAAVLTAVYGTVALAVASATDRRAVASTAIVILFVALSIVVGVFVTDLGATPWLWALDLAGVPVELVQRIHGAAGAHPDAPTAVLAGAAVLWTVGAGATLHVRHRSAGRRR